jgi:Family of unknown function (DUF5961)
MTSQTPARTFCVFSAHDGRKSGHDVEGRSYEDAALTFVESWHPAIDADGEVSVIVRDAESGREECFRIDVEHGEAAPCG